MSLLPALPDVHTDADEQLTGRELRGLTARVTAAHAGRAVGQLVTDVAYVVMSVLLAGLIVVGVVNAVGDAVSSDRAWTMGAAGDGELDVPGAWTGGGRVLAPGTLHLLVGCVVLGLVAGAAARLGPAGVGTAGVHWWLPAPTDRRGLLVPSLVRSVGWGAAAGGAGGVLAGLAAGVTSSAVVAGGLVGAPLGVIVVALAGLAQRRPGGARLVARVGDLLVAAVPVLGLVLVGVGVDVPALAAPSGETTAATVAPTAVLVAVAALLALAVALTWVWAARVDRLRLDALAGRSGTLDRLGAAIFSADSRDLGRALGSGDRPRRPRRSVRFRLVRGPRSALVAADVVLLARTSSAWAQLVGLAALVVLAHEVPVLAAGPGLALVVVVAGVRAAQLGAGGARHAEMVPALDASLPLSGRATRAARTVVPALSAVSCLMLGLVPLALATGSAGWLALGALVGIGCGAGALRSALRPDPDWSGPLLATPAGAFPVNAAAVARQGPDLALLTALPFAIAALLGVVTPAILVTQVVVVAVALAVAAHAPAR